MMTIQGGMPAQNSYGQNASGLSDTQKAGLAQALQNYDVENLSDEDAKGLVSQIDELGIEAGRDLTAALGSVGIDAKALGDQAGGGPGGAGGRGKGGPPPAGAGQGAKGPDSAAIETLQSVVEQLQEATETEEDFSLVLLESLEAAGLDTSSPIVDYMV
ncbi:hypothetical protein [Sulfitobacter sp.]|uniref:hypothetical protein n=1 Tax=Sulfitobacter sp. TaxID=1903071 RepID=UPI003296E4E6